MKTKYFNLINELISTINEIPYNEWATIGADRLVNILKQTKILKNDS